MRVPHTEGDVCGDLCDLLKNVCLGVGVWPHMQKWVRFTYLISLFCSLFHFLSHQYDYSVSDAVVLCVCVNEFMCM